MIKAIFFDMDGTLLSHSLGDVPASARRCLSLLRQKGVLCFMATGRHLLELNNFPLADLEFDEEDFAETEERLNLINHLKGKYGRTIEQILEQKRLRGGSSP